MMQTSSRMAAVPLRGLRGLGRPARSAAVNQAGRRLFASQAESIPLGRGFAQRSTRPFQTLWRTRHQIGRGVSASESVTIALHPAARRGFRFSAWWKNNKPGQPAEVPLSIGARLRKLGREYGWAAVGVYFALSVLDYPFFFLLVKWVGTERIGKVEHWVVTTLIPESVREKWHALMQNFKKSVVDGTGSEDAGEKVEMVGWGVDEARERNKEDASLATQLALAYAVHKSFIFVRVPLTAAVLPKVVKVLRGWGWQIGKRTPR